jgi:FkbM family methyltransferase
VHIRPGTTDPLVYYDVLVNDLYGRYLPAGAISRVLDLGANIGLASAFFLSRFPGCRVVAVEPDPQNAAVCRRNLEPFGERAVLIQGAVWANDARLSLLSQHAGTWASAVDVDPEGQIEGHTIGALLALLGGTADIVKIDIEGAERAILEAPDTTWMDDVRCIAMEPEHADSLEAFTRAAAGRMRIVHRYGDVIFAARANLTDRS